jgi:hypothetical protein
LRNKIAVPKPFKGMVIRVAVVTLTEAGSVGSPHNEGPQAKSGSYSGSL